jgi:glutamine---fructose-6-phosphate transaminase (isomerizing)
MRPLGPHMAAEMAAQPKVLADLVARLPEIVDGLRHVAGPAVPGVAYLARGSSDNAALFTRYAVGLRTGLPSVMLAPSLTTALGARIRGFAGWLVVAVSQSGETPEIVDVATTMQSAGAKLVAITNSERSALSSAADFTVLLDAGPEIAVPATKTVTAQMLVGIGLATALSDERRDFEQAAHVPDAVAEVLFDEESIKHLAKRLAAVTRLSVVGRGFAYAAALETALKLQETTGVMAHGFSTLDFRHGPIRVSGPDAPILALAGSLTVDDETRELRSAGEARNAPFHLIGTTPNSVADWRALGTMAEGILATVRGQQLALLLASELGLDPDQPAGLNKITLTH